MNEEPNLQDLWTLAGQISTIDESNHFFARLIRETENYADPRARSLLHTGVRTIMENTKTDAERARAIIENHILPRCLEQDCLWPPELLSDRDAREILTNWIEQYPDESRIPLRAVLLRRTVASVETSLSIGSIRTIAAFGLRSPWIERTLARLIDREGLVGEAAINALSSLSPGRPLRSRLIRAVIQRTRLSNLANLNHAIQELASPQFIPMLRERMRTDDSDPWIVPFLLGRISDRAPGNRRVQLLVWRAFEEVLQKQKASGRLIAIGNTFENCNVPDVLEYLLVNIGERGFGPHSISSYLNNCYRPAQLKGWRKEHGDLDSKLTEFTALPGSQTLSLTLQDFARRAACEIAFCAGVVDISGWLSRADRSSPVATAEMLNYASFSPPPNVPPFAANLIMEPVDVSTGNDVWHAARIAATKMAAATESMEALNLLIDCGLTGGGAPLVSTTRLVADLAERLSACGSEGLIEHLFGVCETRTNSPARMSAIAGLQRLAELEMLGARHLDRVCSLIADKSLPDYAVAAVIWMIGSLSGVNVNEAVHASLVDRMVSSDVSDNVRFQCLQALIHLEAWRKHSVIVSQVLNLVAADSRVSSERLASYRGWQAYALGLLAVEEPDRYSEAARQVLENGGGEAVHLLLRALYRNSETPQSLACELGRAAVQRSARVLGLAFGETDNFDMIAQLAPREFLLARWEDLWENWMPQVRSALADSFHHIPEPSETDKDRILKLLAGLLDDSTYMVRRSAARAYSRVDSAKFYKLCQEWMQSGQTELRIRSAEGAQWLPVDNRTSIDNTILRDLLQDSEPSVRMASRGSASELRIGEWRALALAELLSSDYRKTGNISRIYPYGRALVTLGDDETVDAIREIGRGRNTPINVKNWLAKLAEDIAQHWKEKTQKWPESLPAWSGQIEEIETRFEIGKRHFEGRISLWQRRQEEPTAWASWGGGFLVTSLPERMRMALDPQSDPVTLCIGGRQAARIWYSGRNSDGRILFVGTGPYPSPAAQ